jgi:hypothetical protein
MRTTDNPTDRQTLIPLSMSHAASPRDETVPVQGSDESRTQQEFSASLLGSGASGPSRTTWRKLGDRIVTHEGELALDADRAERRLRFIAGE